MPLLQVNIDQKLKNAIRERARHYGVTETAIVRIKLTDAFLEEEDDFSPGNVFNADRDNNGKGLLIKDFIKKLND